MSGSVMGKLPATSYVRMVDIWLIFTQLVPFIEDTTQTFNIIQYRLGSQKEPQKSVIRGRCRSSATLGHGNMASDVAELHRQSPGYQYQSQWIHPDMSLEQPHTQNQPRTATHVTDGKIMNIL